MRSRPALALLCSLLLAADPATMRAADAEAASAPAAPSALASPPTAPFALSAYARAETQPAETTIFVFNKILLTAQGFARKGATYETDYSAKVAPFQSLSENGRLTIDVTDDQLRQLARRETVSFTGRAVSKGGNRHKVSGTAIPTDKTSGKLKVSIEASIVTLRFETTYRFTGDTPPATASPAAQPPPAAP